MFSLNLLKVVASSNLCDDLQVFDERPLCGQQFFGDEIGLVCGKLLDTSTNTWASTHTKTIFTDVRPSAQELWGLVGPTVALMTIKHDGLHFIPHV